MKAELRAKNLRARTLAEQKCLRGRRSEDPVGTRAIWREIEAMNLPSWQLRAGEFARKRLSAYRFEVDDYELLAGRTALPDLADPEWDQAWQDTLAYRPMWGQTGHCELDLSRLFALGLDGLEAEIAALLAEASGNDAKEFYTSCLAALDGMRSFIVHAGEAVEAKLAAASPERRPELERLAQVCRNLAHRPVGDFYEGIQMIWFAIQCTMIAGPVWLVCPGRLDRVLAPYLDTVTPELGLALIEGLYFQINAFEPGGLAYGVMLGGVDAEGRDVTNPISYWTLEAMRRTRLVYPTVGICWHEGTPDAIVNLGVELIADGLSNVAFFGDETISKGLESYGVPAREACHYQNSTCVEITPSGSSNIWVASPYFSLCGALVEMIHDAAQSGRRFADFAELMAAYKQVLSARIAAGVAEQNDWRHRRQELGRKPLQSVFTRDCLARGRDIDDGGAVYNWVECSFVGLANLVDSLVVLKHELFGDKPLPLAELDRMIRENFVNDGDARQRFLNKYPKYGNADAEADELIPPLIAFFEEECGKYRMYPDDAPFVPGTFCWEMHQILGSQCEATPDGREAGFPFADGGGPAQGREKSGPTRAALSASSWDHRRLIGGFAFNMKFSKGMLSTPEGKGALKEVILTFLRRGGFETQINVLDAGVLEKALARPEEYSDLVVRIGGYTDYFTRLSDGMKQEVLRRTQYESF